MEPRPTDSALGVLLADGQKSLHTLAKLGFIGQSRDPNFWDRSESIPRSEQCTRDGGIGICVASLMHDAVDSFGEGLGMGDRP